MPNDPLFTMKPNLVLGNPDKPGHYELRNNTDYTECLFEPYATDAYPKGVIEHIVKYIDHKDKQVKESKVKITFTKVRDIFYDKTALSADPGGTPVGKKHVAKIELTKIYFSSCSNNRNTFEF